MRLWMTLAVVLVAPLTLLAQFPQFPPVVPQPTGRLPFGGSEYFRFFLHQKGIKPLSMLPEATNDPKSSIIVCLGDQGWISDEFNAMGSSLKRFIDEGGAVLIATDLQASDNRPNSWERQFGVRFSGKKLSAKADECFEGEEDRPFVKPRGRLPFLANDSPFEMFAGIRSSGSNAIATHRPTEIQIDPIARPVYVLTALAGYPGSTRDADGWGIKTEENHFAVSVRRVDGPGRLLLIGDSDVFRNGLMLFTPDEVTGELSYPNANIRFTNQMIDWLKGPDGSRTQCMFVHDRKLITQFAKEVQLPSVPPTIPPIPPDVLANLLFRMANPMLAEVQNRARPNNALSRWPGPERLTKFFIGGATVLFLWIIWSLLSRGTRKEDKSRWTSLASLGGLLAKGSTSKRKRNDLIETGNVYEAALWRIRDRFDRLGGQPDSDGGMPPILVADNSRQVNGLEAWIKRLWKLGYGDQRVPVTIALWDELNLELEKAVRLAGKGLWCFAAHVPAK